MNIFGWKSAGRGYLRPAKTRVQQDRHALAAGSWSRNSKFGWQLQA